MRPHLRRSAPEQGIGVLELHLAGRVIDRVIGFAREQGVPHVDALAAFPDLEAVQGQHGAVGGRGGIHVQFEGEDRGRPLRGEIGARRAIQRVVALGGDELRRVPKRRQMRKHDEQITDGIALVRIARAWKETIVLIERRGIVLERHAEPLQVGVTCRAALALIHGQRQLDAGAVDLAPADAVGAADQ